MRILLFGKNGQLGWELQRSLACLGELVALDRHSTPHRGELADLFGLASTVRALRPDVIVNAGAYTAVDKAQSDAGTARTINANAVAVLAREAAALGALLVHFSTEYVFDGSGQRAWTEADLPAPLNVYGQTKLEGEQAIQATGPHHLIFRTSWVYAARGDNFAKTMLRLAHQGERLTVVDDQWGAPTGAELLADVAAHCIRQVLQRPGDAGLYHLVPSGQTSWFGFAKYVLAGALNASNATQAVAEKMVAVPSTAALTAAVRPRNCRLDARRLQAVFGLTLPPWQHGVDRLLAEID